jgi:hypothetical protein
MNQIKCGTSKNLLNLTKTHIAYFLCAHTKEFTETSKQA